ncbi:TonB-dependent receptor [Novosphingobium colocasiae]|uniref:TonB-dependent receptor n=1 Tax=Novosphingobium colocasiae TaxID=1256513 RepID=UPI0035AED5E4
MNLRTRLMLGTFVAALVAPAAAQAQDEGGEIVVTANKREQNLNDVGLTITAIGGAALQERGITSLADVASAIPGLAFAPSNTGTPILTLRGVGFNESSLGVYPAVSVYVDQVPQPFPALASHSAFDVQRIEVLKGPQGTLFGQNSTGGAINYIANKPTDTFQAGGDISYGRFNAIEANAFLSGPLTENVRARLAMNGRHMDDWQYSATRDDGNGHQSYIAGRFILDADLGNLKLEGMLSGWRDKSQPQAQQLVGIRVQNWSPERETRHPFYLTPTWSGGNPRIADWSTLVRDPGLSPASSTLPYGFGPESTWGENNLDPFGNRRMWQGSLRADLDLSGMTLTSITSYADYKQRQGIDGDGMKQVTYDLEKSDGYIHSFSQELRLSNDQTGAFRWMIGGNYEKSTTFEDQGLRYFDNTSHDSSLFFINYSGVTNKQKIENIAAFTNLEFDVTPSLTLKAAARYTSSKNRNALISYTTENGNVNKFFNYLGALLNGVTSDFYNENGVPTDAEGNPLPLPFTPITPDQNYTLNSAFMPGEVFRGKLKEDNVSWRVGVDYKVNPDVLLYANVSRGYKAGSFPSLAAANAVALAPVTQEYVTSYEAGLKASLFDRVVQFNAAGFYMDYRDKQVRGRLLDPIFGGLETLVNIPKSKITGFEADVTVRPTTGLTLSGAVTYLKSKILKSPAAPYNYNVLGTVDDFRGDPLPFTPEWSGSVNLDYRYETSGGLTPFFGVSVSARTKSESQLGSSRMDYLGTEGVSPCKVASDGTDVCFLAPGVKNPFMLNGYATVDGRVGVEGKDGAWKLMFWAKNMFNKYYWTNVISSADSAARFAGMPATYGLTIAMKVQ